MLAVTMQRRGFKTAILDADITGPSIPKCFGIHEKAMGSDDGLFPVNTKTGIETMSINELLPDVWRGPVIAGVIKQFWSDVIWNEVDYMFVDLPPGTGDAPLTVFQSIPLDGIIIVTSPQELVSMIVSKAVEMAKMMNVPVLGLIENYSYVKCPSRSRFTAKATSTRSRQSTTSRCSISSRLTRRSPLCAIAVPSSSWVTAFSITPLTP